MPEAYAGVMCLQVQRTPKVLGVPGLEGARGSAPGLQPTLFLDFWFQAVRDVEQSLCILKLRPLAAAPWDPTSAPLQDALTMVSRKQFGEQKQVTSVAGRRQPK